MDAAGSSGAFTHTRLTTSPHIPKNSYLNSHPCEYVKCNHTTFIGTAVSTSNVTTLYVQILVLASSATLQSLKQFSIWNIDRNGQTHREADRRADFSICVTWITSYEIINPLKILQRNWSEKRLRNTTHSERAEFRQNGLRLRVTDTPTFSNGTSYTLTCTEVANQPTPYWRVFGQITQVPQLVKTIPLTLWNPQVHHLGNLSPFWAELTSPRPPQPPPSYLWCTLTLSSLHLLSYWRPASKRSTATVTAKTAAET